MAEGPADKPAKPKSNSQAQRENENAVIGSKLRGYYESIVDEGTPPHLLELLERLHEAETGANKRK